MPPCSSHRFAALPSSSAVFRPSGSSKEAPGACVCPLLLSAGFTSLPVLRWTSQATNLSTTPSLRLRGSHRTLDRLRLRLCSLPMFSFWPMMDGITVPARFRQGRAHPGHGPTIPNPALTTNPASAHPSRPLQNQRPRLDRIKSVPLRSLLCCGLGAPAGHIPP